MTSVLLKTWALFFGFAIISTAHGLQGTLLGIRAIVEGFSFVSTGFVVAGYYVGFLAGSILIPTLLQRVGHIRVFAALASLASIAILLHSVFLEPISWFFIRILTGISLSGIYVIMESWLNDKSTNKTRGKILSIYMIVTFSFVGLGQLLLNLSDPAKVDLFILVSILLSFSLLPILLSITDAPNFDNPKRLTLKELYILTPLGFVGAFFIGLAHSAIFGYGAVYAIAKGFSTFEISIFMIIVSTFGAILQWPIGYLSDRIDRRIILVGVTLIASCLSIFIVASSYLSLIIFFIILAFYAGMSLPMYSLAVAHTNDFLQPDEIVAASSSMAILVGIGAILGPIIASFFMKGIGPDGFFAYLFIVHLLFGLFGLYRMGKRAKPADIESQYVPLPRNISAVGMELNPKVESTEE
ncbi:MAG: MFS transporter [Pelagibacteraceae bacterium]|jgi:MFS family permease|nr:MFS transporter [Pelagibacteraceae bacterium]MDP6783915.1 MFS transporter [Alphaproteobacteria bacterium]MBO6467895.1 MFS transporter [Pelagibacteraceae bacterium]MBO6468775.1 MFS transporter [Pelagibacteraceae bacterium]MBO6469911.1 MFS transporter [Pelagibacteraceae bacterium]|tara:strand:+ start:107 stop:1342 length:1236 start_codon:yes stop_codon:yes gene_type:complete